MSKSYWTKSPYRRHVANPVPRASDCDIRINRARLLDRIADCELQAGHHGVAERLSHQAAEMRELPQ